MTRADIRVHSSVPKSFRVASACSMFDVQFEGDTERHWSVDLALPEDWKVGLIVGPSGSGKSTIARELFGADLVDRGVGYEWPEERSILDAFPEQLEARTISDMLFFVGFGTVPNWLVPYHVLSTGEKFRAQLARLMLDEGDLAVMDEFTSPLNREVAQSVSIAIGKTARRAGKRFVAVSSHVDIAPWLLPDWTYDTGAQKFQLRRGPNAPSVRSKSTERPGSSGICLLRITI